MLLFFLEILELYKKTASVAISRLCKKKVKQEGTPEGHWTGSE